MNTHVTLKITDQFWNRGLKMPLGIPDEVIRYYWSRRKARNMHNLCWVTPGPFLFHSSIVRSHCSRSSSSSSRNTLASAAGYLDNQSFEPEGASVVALISSLILSLNIAAATSLAVLGRTYDRTPRRASGSFSALSAFVWFWNQVGIFWDMYQYIMMWMIGRGCWLRPDC